MIKVQRLVQLSTLDVVYSWVLKSRPSGSSVVMNGRYWVLIADGRPVAAAGLKKRSWCLSEVKHVVVCPEERRKGYGRAILAAVVSRARTPLVMATVRGDNGFWLGVMKEYGFRDGQVFETSQGRIHFLTYSGSMT